MLPILPQPLIHRIRREEPLASELPRRDIAASSRLAESLWMDPELLGHFGEPIGASHPVLALTIPRRRARDRKSQNP